MSFRSYTTGTSCKVLPSFDFIAGLTVGGGAFMWVKNTNKEIPVFQLKMRSSEKSLFELIRKKLGLNGKVYEYTHQNRHYVMLLVRKRAELANIIIPAFEFRLFGPKKEQFDAWKSRFVKENYKMFYVKHF